MLSEFYEFADIWGWYLFIATLQVVVSVLVSRGYRGMRGWLDHEFPDDMPMTTGEWVRAEIHRRQMNFELDVVISKEDDDGQGGSYSPAGQVISLSPKAFFKKDPTFWAVGAHELGHALMHRRLRFIATLLFQSRIVESQLTSFGVVALLVNIAFGSPELTAFAYWMIVAGVICTALVLVDEAWASTLALGILKRDHRLNRRHWLGVLVTLSSAFCTYLGSLIAKLILLAEFDTLIRMLDEQVNYQPGAPLEGWQLAVVGILSVVLALVALFSLFRMVWPGPLSSGDMSLITVAKLLNAVMLIPLVLFLWDQSEAAYWAIWVALASRPLVSLINIVIILSCVLVIWFMSLFVGPIFTWLSKAGDSGPPFKIPPSDLVEEIKYSKHVKARNEGTREYTQWSLRTHHLINLVYVPLLVAYWF